MNKSIFKKTSLIFFCGLFFFIFSVPFRSFFAFYSITEIRPAGALTPVFGLLFGSYGALGAAAGNLAADIFSGFSPSIYIPGFIMQFLYGYLPYKLWYLFCGQEEFGIHLKNVRHIVTYALICFFSALMIAGFLSLLMKTTGITPNSNKAAVFAFFNNLIFCMILGIPLLIAAEYFNITFLVPSERRQKKNPVLLFFGTSIFLSSGVHVFSKFLPDFFSASAYTFFFSASLIFAVLAAAVFPLNAKGEYKSERKKNLSLTEQAIIIFLFLGILAVLATGFTSFYDNHVFVEPEEMWDDLFLSAGITLSFLFACIFIILRFVERVVTRPIEQISNIMVLFAKSTHSVQESKSFIQETQKIVCSNSEIRSLTKSLSHTIIEVQDYTESLARITAEKERMGAELEIAAQIQFGCLPPIHSVLKKNAPFFLAANMTPAKKIGGDFYDFFYTDSEHLALVIADVSGKGIPASLFMMYSKTLLMEYIQFGLSPKETFTLVNERLLINNETGMFVTAFLALIHLPTGNCVYISAGHNPPLIKKQYSDFTFIPCEPSLMLGGLEEASYIEKEMRLEAGDSMFLYTDGITEAMNAHGGFFGNERLLDVLNQGGKNTPEALITRVSKAVAEFAEKEPQSDDITMLAFTYNPFKEQTS